MTTPTTTTTATVDEIKPAEKNVRADDSTDIKGLMDTISQVGVLQPIVVDTNGVIISGHRRYRAVQQLIVDGELTVDYRFPIHVRDGETNGHLELMLIENMQRVDLNPIEEAKGFHELGTTHQLKQSDIAARVGKSPSLVGARLRLLYLPDFAHEALIEGKINLEQAEAMVPLHEYPDEIREIIELELTANGIARRVETMKRKEAVDRVIGWIQGAGAEAFSQYEDLAERNLIVDHGQPSTSDTKKKADVVAWVSKGEVYRVVSNYDGSILIMSTMDAGDKAPAASNTMSDKAKKLKKANRLRAATMQEIVGSATIPIGAVNRAFMRSTLDHLGQHQMKLACRLLSLTDDDLVNNNYRDTLIELLLTSKGTQQKRAVLAVTIAGWEQMASIHGLLFKSYPHYLEFCEQELGLTFDQHGAPIKDEADDQQ